MCAAAAHARAAPEAARTAEAPASATAKAPPLPGAPSRQLPITIDAASASVDYKTNTLEYKQVVITQGPTRVQADSAHASGLNFANSRWTFDGNVRIDTEPNGKLRADQAVIEFKDQHLSRATVTGKPATFEQERAPSQVARGRANEIVYDVNEGTVRLSNDAWLSDGQNEISGPLLVYNIKAQHVQAAAAPGTSERVHIVIAPQNAPGAKGKNEAAKPPPSPPPNTPPKQPPNPQP